MAVSAIGEVSRGFADGQRFHKRTYSTDRYGKQAKGWSRLVFQTS